MTNSVWSKEIDDPYRLLPVSEEKIEEAEKHFGVQLPTLYKKLIKE